MQEKAKPLALLADTVLLRDRQAVDEQRIRVDAGATHLLDLADFDVGAVEVGVEQGESVGRTPALVAGRGSGEQQDLVRDLGGGRPHLAPIDDVAPVVAASERGDAAGVESGVRLRHPEAADLLSGDERRKKARFLRLGAETTIGFGPKMLRWIAEAALIAPAESVIACIITAASVRPSPLPPCSTGIAMPRPAAPGDGLAVRMRKRTVAVAGEPVVVAELRGDATDALVDRALIVGQCEIHDGVREVPGSEAVGGEVGQRQSTRLAPLRRSETGQSYRLATFVVLGNAPSVSDDAVDGRGTYGGFEAAVGWVDQLQRKPPAIATTICLPPRQSSTLHNATSVQVHFTWGKTDAGVMR